MTGTVAARQFSIAEQFSPWNPLTLHDVLDRAITHWPDRPFVIGEARCWTYAELGAWSVKIAMNLQRHGIRTGDRVALVMANYPEFVVLKYALSRLGAVCVPLNILNQGAELQYLLEQSACRALVTMDRFRGLDYLEMLTGIAPGWAEGGRVTADLEQVFVFQAEGDGSRSGGLPFSVLESPVQDDAAPAGMFSPVASDALCDVIYTSGTSGKPKGVELTHDMLTRTAFGAAYARAFADGHGACRFGVVAA